MVVAVCTRVKQKSCTKFYSHTDAITVPLSK
jgi:hypothetical protein